MSKQVFLDIIKNGILNKMNIDYRILDSFKRVLIKAQHYFDKMGYSDTVDFEKIVNNYLIPNELVEREAVRNSEGFRNTKEHYRNQGLSEKVWDDEKLLDEYISLKYNVGLRIIVDTTPDLVGSAGRYDKDTNTIRIGINPNELSSDKLDDILCHEFVHFLTSSGKNDLIDIYDAMPGALVEPLTEMLAHQIMESNNPVSYKQYCDLIRYINLIAGINDYNAFLNRKIDDRYTNYFSTIQEMQKILDMSGYKSEIIRGDIPYNLEKELCYSANKSIFYGKYSNINELIDGINKLYSSSFKFPYIKQIEAQQKLTISHFLFEHNILDNDLVIDTILQMTQIKNCLFFLDSKNLFPIIVHDIEKFVDDHGEEYHRDIDTICKSPHKKPLYKFFIAEMMSRLRIEYDYVDDVDDVDFGLLKEKLIKRQKELEKEIENLLGVTCRDILSIDECSLDGVVIR